MYYLCIHNQGGLAQLARALAWHARGHQFDPGILHKKSLSNKFFVRQVLFFVRSCITRGILRRAKPDKVHIDFNR